MEQMTTIQHVLFQGGCCEVNGTVVNDVSGGLSHIREYDFLNIVNTNIHKDSKKT